MRRNALAQAIGDVAEALERPRFLRVVASYLVHDRPVELRGDACPCCRSTDAEIVDRILAADVVIDTFTGERTIEADATAEVWAELIDLAQRIDVPIRCTPTTLLMLQDRTGRHLFASGGHRAAKTTTGLYWLALQILLFGGMERRVWLVAPTDEKCFRLLEKMFRPTPSASGGSVPPILPSALVESAPATHRASNLDTRLIDGTVISLRSFHNDPGAERVKSDPIVAALVDEAAHLPSEASLSALRGRCVDLDGRLWLASTAIPSSHLRPLVDKLLEWQRLPADDPARTSGEHVGAAWRFELFPMLGNPWLRRANIERDMRTVDMSKPENRRDYLGEWCSSEGLCWTRFTEAHIVVHEARSVRDLSTIALAANRAPGHVDITPSVARGLFSRTNPHHKMARASNFAFIIGQDVNLNPMSSALLQITAPADKQDDRDAWHYWIVDMVSTSTSNSLAHAERLVSPELGRVIDPGGNASPLRGCGVIVDSSAIGRDPTARAHGQTGSVVETFWRSGLDARAPLYRKTKEGKVSGYNGTILGRFTLMHRLVNEGRLHVFSRAGTLLNAFAVQVVTDDGIIPLDARSGKWDRVMGPMDAASYAILAAANMVAAPKLTSWQDGL
jgi:hypothetical protein